MKKFFTVLFILALVSFSYAGILQKPYLMSISDSTVYVMVECSTTDTVTVNYGLDSTYGEKAVTEIYSSTTASPVTYIHKIKLTSLLPDTVYHFSAQQNTPSYEDYSFRTAPSEGKPFRFAWEADMRTGTSVHDQVSKLIKSYNPTLLLQGGDVCSGSSYSYFKNEFFRVDELSLISQVPFVWSPGNHETWGTNTKAFSKTPASPSRTEDYYSFDYGDIHFLVLNTQVSYAPGSAQYNFAMSDLAATDKSWKIVIHHIPGYTAGGNGAHGEDSNMKLMAQNVFTPNRIDLDLTGHNHFYQHNRVSGIDYLTIGSAGAPLVSTGTASYTIKSVSDYCFGIFDYTPGKLTISIYNNLNVLLDSLTLRKNATRVNEKKEKPEEFNLLQNYPNPFNPSTKIGFVLPSSGLVSLKVFDILGREISTLINGSKPAGYNEVDYHPDNLNAGVYFYRLQYGNYSAVKKLIILK